MISSDCAAVTAETSRIFPDGSARERRARAGRERLNITPKGTDKTQVQVTDGHGDGSRQWRPVPWPTRCTPGNWFGATPKCGGPRAMWKAWCFVPIQSGQALVGSRLAGSK